MRPSATRSSISLLAPVLAMLLSAFAGGGCQPLAQHARVAYDTAGLDVERSGWDTLRVTPRFVRHTSLGPARPAQAGTTFVHVFNASYDTLYAGPATRAVPLPDRALASREPLLVEACGTVAGSPGQRAGQAARALCEQATVFASPKRLRAEASEITFPEGADFQRGRYELRFVAERRAFADTTWERLPASPLAQGYLLARAESAGGRGTVRVPLSPDGRGAFDLARYTGYDDFQYHLRSAMDRPSSTSAQGGAPPLATVAFEVQAGLNGGPPRPVTRVRKEVRRLTPDERRRRAHFFAQSAAEEIARRLRADAPGSDHPEGAEGRVRATVRNWRYDRLDGGRYEIELRVHWYEAGAPDDRYTLEGTLTIEAGGRQARFAGERGNERTVRRWRSVVDGTELSLGTLAQPDEDALEELEAIGGELPRQDLAERRAHGPRGRHSNER